MPDQYTPYPPRGISSVSLFTADILVPSIAPSTFFHSDLFLSSTPPVSILRPHPNLGDGELPIALASTDRAHAYVSEDALP